jgi:hypothetical protein
MGFEGNLAVLGLQIRICKDPKLFVGSGSKTGPVPYQKSSKTIRKWTPMIQETHLLWKV